MAAPIKRTCAFCAASYQVPHTSSWGALDYGGHDREEITLYGRPICDDCYDAHCAAKNDLEKDKHAVWAQDVLRCFRVVHEELRFESVAGAELRELRTADQEAMQAEEQRRAREAEYQRRLEILTQRVGMLQEQNRQKAKADQEELVRYKQERRTARQFKERSELSDQDRREIYEHAMQRSAEITEGAEDGEN